MCTTPHTSTTRDFNMLKPSNPKISQFKPLQSFWILITKFVLTYACCTHIDIHTQASSHTQGIHSILLYEAVCKYRYVGEKRYVMFISTYLFSLIPSSAHYAER